MKKPSIKNKKEVTLDDLAIMVTRGFESNDRSFENIEQRFENIDKKFFNLENNISSFKSETEANFKKVRNDILDIGDRFVPRFEFDNLLIRLNL